MADTKENKLVIQSFCKALESGAEAAVYDFFSKIPDCDFLQFAGVALEVNPDFCLVSNDEEVIAANELYGENESDKKTKLIFIGKISQVYNFMSIGGAAILDPAWFQEDEGKYLIKRILDSSRGILLQEIFQQKFSKYYSQKITSFLRLGYYSDQLVAESISQENVQFNYVAIRSFFDHALMYMNVIKDMSLASFPCEVDYAFNSNYFTVLIHIACHRMNKEYIISSLGEEGLRNPLASMLKSCWKQSDYLDITYHEKAKKLCLTGLWFKSDQKNKSFSSSVAVNILSKSKVAKADVLSVAQASLKSQDAEKSKSGVDPSDNEHDLNYEFDRDYDDKDLDTPYEEVKFNEDGKVIGLVDENGKEIKQSLSGSDDEDDDDWEDDDEDESENSDAVSSNESENIGDITQKRSDDDKNVVAGGSFSQDGSMASASDAEGVTASDVPSKKKKKKKKKKIAPSSVEGNLAKIAKNAKIRKDPELTQDTMAFIKASLLSKNPEESLENVSVKEIENILESYSDKESIENMDENDLEFLKQMLAQPELLEDIAAQVTQTEQELAQNTGVLSNALENAGKKIKGKINTADLMKSLSSFKDSSDDDFSNSVSGDFDEDDDFSQSVGGDFEEDDNDFSQSVGGNFEEQGDINNRISGSGENADLGNVSVTGANGEVTPKKRKKKKLSLNNSNPALSLDWGKDLLVMPKSEGGNEPNLEGNSSDIADLGNIPGANNHSDADSSNASSFDLSSLMQTPEGKSEAVSLMAESLKTSISQMELPSDVLPQLLSGQWDIPLDQIKVGGETIQLAEHVQKILQQKIQADVQNKVSGMDTSNLSPNDISQLLGNSLEETLKDVFLSNYQEENDQGIGTGVGGSNKVAKNSTRPSVSTQNFMNLLSQEMQKNLVVSGSESSGSAENSMISGAMVADDSTQKSLVSGNNDAPNGNQGQINSSDLFKAMGNSLETYQAWAKANGIDQPLPEVVKEVVKYLPVEDKEKDEMIKILTSQLEKAEEDLFKVTMGAKAASPVISSAVNSNNTTSVDEAKTTVADNKGNPDDVMIIKEPLTTSPQEPEVTIVKEPTLADDLKPIPIASSQETSNISANNSSHDNSFDQLGNPIPINSTNSDEDLNSKSSHLTDDEESKTIVKDKNSNKEKDTEVKVVIKEKIVNVPQKPSELKVADNSKYINKIKELEKQLSILSKKELNQPRMTEADDEEKIGEEVRRKVNKEVIGGGYDVKPRKVVTPIPVQEVENVVKKIASKDSLPPEDREQLEKFVEREKEVQEQYKIIQDDMMKMKRAMDTQDMLYAKEVVDIQRTIKKKDLVINNLMTKMKGTEDEIKLAVKRETYQLEKDYKKQIHAQTMKLEAEVKKLAAEKEALRKSMTALDKNKKKEQIEKVGLNGEVKMSPKQIMELEAAKKKLENNVKMIEQQNKFKEKELEDKQSLIQKLEREKKALLVEFDQFKQNLKNSAKVDGHALAQSKEALQNEAKLREQLNALKAAHQKELSREKVELEGMKVQLSTEKNNAKMMAMKLQQAQAELEALKKDMSEKGAGAGKDAAGSTGKLRMLEETHKKMLKDFNDSKLKLEETKKETANLTNKNNELMFKMKEKEKQVEKLMSELKALKEAPKKAG